MKTSLAFGINRTALFLMALVMTLSGYVLIAGNQALAAACVAPPTDYGIATNTVTISNSATYQVWSNLYAPNSSDNSYLLEISGPSGTTCFTVGDGDVPMGSYSWISHHGGVATNKSRLQLAPGSYTLKMIGREPAVKLGRVILTSDLSCTPTGSGDNCLVSDDTVAPAVDITAPAAEATVSGDVAISANATDAVGVSRVEFYANGLLLATDTAAPFSYDWRTVTTQNGRVTLMAKAFDANGNVGVDSVTVTVMNGDTQSPSVPANVRATAASPTSVTVSWTASTDNVGVLGYVVTRNDQVVGRVSSGTQYTDGTALPDTRYSYRVAAHDMAQNFSSYSSEAIVTTPGLADNQAPSKPANLQLSIVNSKQINLAWTASTDNVGVKEYEIYRSAGGGSASKVATVQTLSYGDTGLKQNTQYTYYIIAKDSAGNSSPQSDSQSGKTPKRSSIPTTGTLTGKVTFSSNRDKHAHVVVNVNGTRRSYDTDSKGNYILRNVPAGTYNIRYNAQGSQGKTVEVQIKPGKTVKKDITLQAK